MLTRTLGYRQDTIHYTARSQMTSLKTDFVFVFVSITVWVLIPVQNLTESGYLKNYTPIKNKRMLIENIFLL